MRIPRWWQDRSRFQRFTFAWASVAVVAALAREMKRQRHPYIPDWRVAGVTPTGDTLEVDLSSIGGKRDAYGVRLRPGSADARTLIVVPDCGSRRMADGRVHRSALGLTPQVIALTCAQGH